MLKKIMTGIFAGVISCSSAFAGVTGAQGVVATTVPAPGSVPLSSLATQADQTVLCNNSGGTASPSACTAPVVSGIETAKGGFGTASGLTNGSGDNASAIAAAVTGSGTALLPKGVYPSTTALTAMDYRAISLFGGQAQDSASKYRAPWAAHLQTAPTALGDWTSFATSFTTSGGAATDLSRSLLPMEVDYNGTSVSYPASGYTVNRENVPILMVGRNLSGGNTATSGNSGRSGISLIYGKAYNLGGGDYPVIFCDGFVNGTRAGSTSFLANPQVACLSGQLFAGQAGVFLQGIGDLNFNDNGYDISAMGMVLNAYRSVATGAKNANWMMLDLQNPGTKDVDAFIRFSPKGNIGIDASSITYTGSILTAYSLASGGTGYTAGDLLCAAGGTYDQQTCVKVLTVNGGGTILTMGLDRHGDYTVLPASPNSFTGGTGTGASINVTYDTGPILVTPTGSCWYGNASNDTGVYSTRFSSTTILGTSKLCNNSGAWSFTGGLSMDTLALSANGALSAPVEKLTGTWVTGGDSTTTKPTLLIEPTGTTSNAWSTSGTGLGVNAASGFAGRLIDAQVNGSLKFAVGASTLTIQEAVNMNVSQGGNVTNIGTGSTTGTVSIGGGSNAVTISATTATVGGTTANITATTLQRNGNTVLLPRRFTATYDPASLAAQTSRVDTVTVTGVTTSGGSVSVNLGTDVAAGCVMANVYASAADTIKINWFNANTVAACDTASSTIVVTQAQ